MRKFLQKINDNLDIWRGILYSIVLGDIAINNFQYLGSFSFNNSNYYILSFAFLLTIIEPINRFLYRDFTTEVNNNDKYELLFSFTIFGIEMAALFGLCFGVKELKDMQHWEYLSIYFLCNFLLNWFQLSKVYTRLKLSDNTLNPIIALSKIAQGKSEYFYFGKDSSKEFKGFSFLSEQYIAFNTLFSNLFLFILLIFYNDVHSFILNYVDKPIILVVVSVLLSLCLTIQKKRNYFTSIILFLSYCALFSSFTAITSNRLGFIICCFIHYLFVSFCYLRLYIVELMENQTT